MLMNVKNTTILKNIFDYISSGGTKTLLKLIKYNKMLQKRLNISIKDYQNFNNIKLEIIPVESNKLKRANNYFINFNKEIKDYQILFDDIIQDKKRIYITSDDKVNKIKVEINGFFTSISELFHTKRYGQFAGCDCIKQINFTRFCGNNIFDMSEMFYGCSSLTKVSISEFNSKNVKNMSYMFYGCSSLDDLDLSKINTENVSNMFCMFSKCSSLKELDFSNFNTKNAVNFGNMFENCKNLKKMKNFNLNTNQVTNMSSMFEGCESLTFINTSNFKTNKVYSFENMFKNSLELSYLDISNFVFNNNAYVREMFSGCHDMLKKEMKAQNKRLKGEAFYDDPKKRVYDNEIYNEIDNEI